MNNYLYHSSIGQKITQSHTSEVKVKHMSSTCVPDSAAQDHASSNQKHKRNPRRNFRSPPAMLSDPLDSSSSDTQSFDEDDMYGSDSGVESFSLNPDSEEEERSTTDSVVCTGT